MRPDDLYEFVRHQPFQPFRIHTTDGKTFDVHHPDQMIVLRSRIIVPAGGTINRVPDRTEHVALLHIVRLEQLETVNPSEAN